MRSTSSYVRTDEHGDMRVGNSRILLDIIVGGFERGDAPETIRSDFPALSLEEVYGAITYYFANRRDVEAYLQRRQAIADEIEAQIRAQPEPPVVTRLRALKAARASQ